MDPCTQTECNSLAELLIPITPAQCQSIAEGNGIDPLDGLTSCDDAQSLIDRLQEMEDAIAEGAIVIAANQESACHKPGLPTHASILNGIKQTLQLLKCVICSPSSDAKAYHYNYNVDSTVTTQPNTVPANLVAGDTVIENFNDVIKYWTWNGLSWVLDFQIDKSDTVEITDADLATAGSPTITDIQNYATANGLSNTAIYYIGNGTADDPDYVWIVDEQGNIVNTENPETPDIITTLTNTVAGNLIGTYTNEAGTAVDINETVTAITNTVAGHKIADYTNEAGTVVAINETVTNVGVPTLSAGNILTIPYTDENGVTTNRTVDLTTLAVDINVASLAYNPVTGEITLTETDGSTHIIDIGPFAETIFTANDSSTIDFTTSGTANHTLTGAVKLSAAAGNTIVANADGLYSSGAVQTPIAFTSPNNTVIVSATGTDNHTLTADVNAPLKTIACGGDITPADAVAQYNPVHRRADGTLWTKTDSKSISHSSITSGFNVTNTNLTPINTPFYRSTTPDISYTNNTCRPMTVLINYYGTVQTLINSGDRVEVKLQMSYDGGVTWQDALREVVRLGSTALEFPHTMAGATKTSIAPGSTWTSRGRICIQSLLGTGSWHLTSNMTIVQMEVTE